MISHYVGTASFELVGNHNHDWHRIFKQQHFDFHIAQGVSDCSHEHLQALTVANDR